MLLLKDLNSPSNRFGKLFLENRNLAAHTYNEEMAETLYAQLPEFQKEIEIVCERIRKL